MVKNRSQKQTDSGMTLAEAFDSEKAFFQSHAHFRSLDSGYFGTFNLMERLTAVLVRRIQDGLPGMVQEIDTLLRDTRDRLEKMGNPPPQSEEEIQGTILKFAQEIQQCLSQSTKGEYTLPVLRRHPNLRLMALLRKTDGPQNALRKEIARLKPDLSDTGVWGVPSLAKAISESRGRELPGFINSNLATTLIQDWLDQCREPVVEYASEVRKMTTAVFEGIIDQYASQYRSMMGCLKLVVRKMVDTRSKTVLEALKSKLSTEDQPFTSNSYFMSTYNSIVTAKLTKYIESHFGGPAFQDEKKRQIPIQVENITAFVKSYHTIGGKDNAKHEAENLQALLVAYRKTATKRMLDDICMIVDAVLITNISDDIANCFLLGAQSPRTAASFFQEDPLVQEQRAGLENKLERLVKARDIVSQVEVT